MSEPGRLISAGRTADVHEYGHTRVIKMTRPGFEDSLRSEAENTTAVVKAGVPAPAVHGLVSVGGRTGIVLDRVPGVLMVDLIMDAPERSIEWARLLGRTHGSILERHTDELPDVKAILGSKIDMAATLAANQRRVARQVLDSLPSGNSLLHGDFHPLNLLVDGDDVTVIDWVDAARGPAAADIARTMWLISSDSIPPNLPDREAIEEILEDFAGVYLEEVLRATEVTEDEVAQWALPVLAGRAVEGIESEMASLLDRIDELMAPGQRRLRSWR